MRLRFESMERGEDEAFGQVVDQLLGELDAWARERFDDDGERAANAHTFLQWKYGYGDGQLDIVTRFDLGEYLLEWCPRKVSGPPDLGYDLVDGLAAYVEFMAATDRLIGGAELAAELLGLLDDVADDVFEAMGDESKFGMAKSLFSAPLTRPDGSGLPDLSSLDDLGDLTEEACGRCSMSGWRCSTRSRSRSDGRSREGWRHLSYHGYSSGMCTFRRQRQPSRSAPPRRDCWA